MKTITILLTFIFLTYGHCAYAEFFPHADSPIEQAGDIMQLAIPISAALFSLAMQDWEGTRMLAESYALTLGTTYALKYSVRSLRPDGSNYQSFPSGHTASAFAGAAYWQRRYGWYVGLPMYLAAGFVGYSRIYAKKHHLTDVLVGAAIGYLFNYIFTLPYNNNVLGFSAMPSKDGIAVYFTYRF